MEFSKEYSKVEKSVFAIYEVDGNKQTKIGTGVHIDGGFGVTCAHCITDVNKMYITFDMKNLQLVSNIQLDVNLDLAIFPLTHSNPSVKVRSSKSLKVGNECFLVGYPLDINQKNAAHVYISSFTKDQNSTDLIRLDTSVNKGNSGGPLFNYDCELVGIINAKHGGVSKILQSVVNHKSSGQVLISGVNPVATMQQMIAEMDYYMNLGIGYAIEIDQITTLESKVNIL